MRKLKILLVGLLLSFGLKAQTDPAYAKKLESLYKYTVDLIQPDSLQKLMKSNQKMRTLDTRMSVEYNVSHLKGAEFIDYDSFKTKNFSGSKKDDLIIVYCSVGYRSERVGEKLKKAGYTNVYNLYGGIFEWVNRGFSVFNAEGKANKVHTYSEKWGRWVKPQYK